LTRWHGIVAALVAALSSAVSVFDLTASFASEPTVTERAVDTRAPVKPTAVRHDPADPKLNFWGGSEPGAFVPASMELPLPRLDAAAGTTIHAFGLAVRFELVRDGASRAPPRV
jgi:hypothetical protein